ncbi:hypothetical protein [Selenomonas noxia]|uniref:hypothetical protein n=1 Tax=Selenomonas noxia TaxID=135083 RepID=UPI0023EFF26E|nr:hypothetical protein [Selenomonas noxia]
MLKVSQWLRKGKKYLRNMTKSHAAMRYIVWYAAMLVIGCTIYVSAWLYDWYTALRPDLVEFRNFLHEISGAAWIAAIGFLAKAFIDQNNNGIPDQYEEKENKDGKSTSERSESEL